MPIQYFRKIPIRIAHRIDGPRIAPARVAKITSPEPIYSDVQTKDGPTRVNIAKPFGGIAIPVFDFVLSFTLMKILQNLQLNVCIWNLIENRFSVHMFHLINYIAVCAGSVNR
jgi:hypothetical protein